MSDGSDVLFLANTIGRQDRLAAPLDGRAVFGFPTACGTRVDPLVRYALIAQQKTTSVSWTRN